MIEDYDSSWPAEGSLIMTKKQDSASSDPEAAKKLAFQVGSLGPATG